MNKGKTSNFSGITLIALVITVIVLLILAGISISMLSGNNSILQKATQAKENTERTQIIENARLDILACITDKKGNDLTADEIKEILGIYFTSNTIPEDLTDLTQEMTTKSGTYKVKLSEVLNGANIASPTETGATLGEKYEEDWIGKTIRYTAGPSGNEVSDWIIIGQDKTTKDVLITTANPVGNYKVDYSLADWCDYIKNLNTECSNYSGTIGKNKVAVKDTRSITLDDINNAVGFTLPETFDNFTFGATQDFEHSQVNYFYPDETNKTWINPQTSGTTWPHANDAYSYFTDRRTYKYASAKNDWSYVALTSTNLSKPDNMVYVLANNSAYWVASRSINVYSDGADFDVAVVSYGSVGVKSSCLCYSDASEGYEDVGNRSMALRPCVVLSSEIPYDDVKDDIGDYAEYEYSNPPGDAGLN